MTGYEEILTDPSYAGQIITFTFPHIGNVGTNEEDIETVNMAATPGARGVILHSAITEPSNYRATSHLDHWLKARGIIGLSGIDTRALTALIRVKGMPNAVIAHEPSGKFDLPALKKEAQRMAGPRRHGPGADGDERRSASPGTRRRGPGTRAIARQTNPEFHVVAIDYGIKRNILRLLAGTGCKVTVVPAKTSAEDIMALKPDGVFLSNGPGDPAATGEYAVPVIKKLIDSGTPTFGICLGHQMLGIAVGGKTMKMHQGHHGANHPVKDLTTGKVEITSMNHGFAVDKDTLPKNVEQTHVSLFDGSNCGLALKDKPVFSVQYHPEASPGPRDSHYLFTRFVEMMRRQGTKSARLHSANDFALCAPQERRPADAVPRFDRCIGMTSSQPLTFMFKDDGKVPNNPALPALVYKAAVDFGGNDPARAIEKSVRAERLGPRPMAQRHLSVRALSFDDP